MHLVSVESQSLHILVEADEGFERVLGHVVLHLRVGVDQVLDVVDVLEVWQLLEGLLSQLGQLLFGFAEIVCSIFDFLNVWQFVIAEVLFLDLFHLAGVVVSELAIGTELVQRLGLLELEVQAVSSAKAAEDIVYLLCEHRLNVISPLRHKVQLLHLVLLLSQVPLVLIYGLVVLGITTRLLWGLSSIFLCLLVAVLSLR